jgi:hypothetical protein
MRLRVIVRVAGHTKSSYTYLQLLEDLVEVIGGPSSLVEAGFVDYRMIWVAIDLPPSGMDRRDIELFCELAAAELRSALKAGIGIDPRMMSGRLAVVVQRSTEGGPGSNEEAAERLRGLGYRVEVLDGEASG